MKITYYIVEVTCIVQRDGRYAAGGTSPYSIMNSECYKLSEVNLVDYIVV